MKTWIRKPLLSPRFINYGPWHNHSPCQRPTSTRQIKLLGCIHRDVLIDVFCVSTGTERHCAHLLSCDFTSRFIFQCYFTDTVFVTEPMRQNWWIWVNSSPPGQNGGHFADDIFGCVSVNEKFCILIEISLKFVLKGQINNIFALV